MRIRPFIGTLSGFAVGLIAIAVWMITFEPHGGPELSWYLFPLSRLVLEHLYPGETLSAFLWYASALLQWVLLGAVTDIVRKLLTWRFADRIADGGRAATEVGQSSADRRE